MGTFLLLFALSILSSTYEEEIQFITPAAQSNDEYSYIILPNLADEIKTKQVHFKVKACSDIYVALINGNTESDSLYEIVLGGWSNTKSVFRTSKQQNIGPQGSGLVLDCTQFKAFVIYWNNQEIYVEDTESKIIVLKHQSQTVLNPIRNLGIYTAGGRGDWIISSTSDIVTEFDTPSTVNAERHIILKSYPVVLHKSLLFGVKACHYANILLINGETDSDPMYVIVLGAYNNDKILFRINKQIPETKSVAGGPFLDCDSSKVFWINWDSNKISVGKGSLFNLKPILEWTDKNGINPITNIGFFTTLGSGKWEFYTPVNCSINQWSSWGTCSRTCGDGRQQRSRTYKNRTPKFGGLPCTDPSLEESKICNTQPCPINGGFNEWSVWGACSSTCGEGRKLRARNCTNPCPQYGGIPCIGLTEESQTCSTLPCPAQSATSSIISNMICMCSCQQVGKWSILVGINMTKQEIEMILKPEIEKMKTSMAIQKKNVSSYIRRKTSADDKRNGPKYLGWFNVGIICILVIIVILSDCTYIHT